MNDPVPMLIWCPMCKARHIDEGEFATKVHHTHSCQNCGLTWRPAVVPTCGVQFLPGFKNKPAPTVTVDVPQETLEKVNERLGSLMTSLFMDMRKILNNAIKRLTTPVDDSPQTEEVEDGVCVGCGRKMVKTGDVFRCDHCIEMVSNARSEHRYCTVCVECCNGPIAPGSTIYCQGCIDKINVRSEADTVGGI